MGKRYGESTIYEIVKLMRVTNAHYPGTSWNTRAMFFWGGRITLCYFTVVDWIAGPETFLQVEYLE